MMQRHKILAFLLALVASVCLWFYAVTVVNPDDTISISGIRVRIDGTDILEARELMLVGGEDLRVSVKLSGRRSDLKELNNDTVTAVASVARVTEEGDATVSWSLEYPSNVAAGDITVESRSSYNVVVPIRRIAERTDVPLRVDCRVTAADGFWTDPSELICNTQTLTIRGPAEEVEAIEEVVAVIEAENAEEMVECDAPCVFTDASGEALELSGYCTVSADTVHLALPVYHSKMVDLKLKLTDGGGVTAADVSSSIEPPSLLLTGSEEALSQVDDSLEIAQIDLTGYFGGAVPSVSMEAIRGLLPSGVTVRTEESNAAITLKLVGITVKTIAVPVEQITRLDDDGTLAFVSNSVMIQVRGKLAAVNALKAEDIRVSVDMKNDYDPETGMVKLKAELPKDCKAALVHEPFTARVTADTDPNAGG